MRLPRLFSILLQIFLAGFDKNSQSDGVKTKNWTLENRTIRYQDDSSGRYILRFTPYLVAHITGTGEISMAHWEVWEDEPQTHAPAWRAALENARVIMEKLQPYIPHPEVR